MNAAVQPLSPITLLHKGVNVQPLLDQLAAHPELWDQNTFRTAGYSGQQDNPHQRISDIIVRFNDWKHWQGDRMQFNELHESVWWAAYEKLTYIKPLVFDLARLVEAEQIGMVLITRIPPHTNIKPHVDSGWHAQHYTKFALQLKAHPGQKFCYVEEELETEAGDLFAFDNSRLHWVENPTSKERITLIMCLRLKQPTCLQCHGKGT